MLQKILRAAVSFVGSYYAAQSVVTIGQIVIKAEYNGLNSACTTILKKCLSGSAASEATINHCAKLTAGAITGLTAGALTLGVYQDPKEFVEYLGIEGFVDWVSSHL